MERDNLIRRHGLHRVDFLDTVPVCLTCDGNCPFPQACQVPLREPAPRKTTPQPRTQLRLPSSRAFRVCAVLAGCGALFIAGRLAGFF